MYFRQEHPAAAKALLLGGVAALVVAIIGGLVWISVGGDDDPAKKKSPSTSAAAASVCGLPAGSQKIPTAGPDATWTRVGRIEVPISAKFGPKTTKEGIRSCFAHSPSGALLAAASQVYEDDPNVDLERMVEQRVATGPLYDDYLAMARTGRLKADAAAPELASAAVAAFKVDAYSARSARVQIVYKATGTGGEEGFVAQPMHLVWRDGDWKLYLDSLDFTGPTLSSLAGYSPWSADAGSPGPGASAPVLGRTAPAWDVPAVAPREAAGQPRTPDEPKPGCSGALCNLGNGLQNIAQAPVNLLGGAANAAGGAVAGSAFDNIAQKFVEAQNWALKTLLTAWLKLPDPDVSSADSLPVWLDGHLSFFVAFIAIGACFVAAYRLAVTGKFEHVADLAGVLWRVVLVGGLIGTVMPLTLAIGDEFSKWILKDVNPEVFTKGMVYAGVTNSAVLLTLGLIVLLVQLIQVVIMIFRGGVIMYLTATLTLFAAASNTETGKGGFQRAIAWLVAFVLYKPAAALIYAGAFQLTSSKGIINQITGIVFMILAVLALPALMKLIAPATASIGGGNAGALAGAMVGAGVATGAIVATGGAGAAAGGFGGGAMASGSGAAEASGASMATGATPTGPAPAPSPMKGPDGASSSDSGSDSTGLAGGQDVPASSGPEGASSSSGGIKGGLGAARSIADGAAAGGQVTGAAGDIADDGEENR